MLSALYCSNYPYYTFILLSAMDQINQCALGMGARGQGIGSLKVVDL